MISHITHASKRMPSTDVSFRTLRDIPTAVDTRRARTYGTRYTSFESINAGTETKSMNALLLNVRVRMCIEQLTYAGVFEAVQIRKSGYPFRLPHRRFANRYRCLAYKESGWVGLGTRQGDYKGMCSALLRCVNQVRCWLVCCLLG